MDMAVSTMPTAKQMRTRTTIVLSDLEQSQLPSAQFERRQRKQRKYQRRNPETHNHLRLRPAQQFEVMVDGCHLENAFLAQLVRPNLQAHRQRLDNKNPSDERQQQF